MSDDIIISESFSEEDDRIFSMVERKQFDHVSMMTLKLQAAVLSQETLIHELLSYDSVAKNLEYKLPHQPQGALRLLRDLNGSGLLADEVGLGKTITAGMVLKECILRGFVKKALILTPPSLVDQWVAELKEKFEIDIKIIEHEEDWARAELAIASIDRVKIYDQHQGKFRHAKAHDISWDLLIVDEAHKLKDKNTRRWEFVDRMQKKRFLILTATPFQNDLLELYNLLHLLKRGHLGTQQEFKKTFFHRGNKRHPLKPHELRRKLQEVMIRRRRDETGIEYRKRIPKIVAVDLSPEELEIYNEICDMLKTKYFSVQGNEITGRLVVFALLPKVTSSRASAMESLQGIINNPKYHSSTKEIAQKILDKYSIIQKDSKIEKLISIIQEILERESNPRILIYTKHPSTLRYIVEKLAPFNLSIVEYLGGLTREERSARVQKFKEGANILISTETGAEGLNFQFCHNLINYDLPWNPMAVEQRIGRLDRIGQKSDMMIYSLATKKTMEEHVVDLIINKMCCIGLVIGELPIILFNLGLDGYGSGGVHKIEELLMDAFIDSKNNLDLFARDVGEIHAKIQEGIASYQDAKTHSAEVLDAKPPAQEASTVIPAAPDAGAPAPVITLPAQDPIGDRYE